MLLGPHRPEQKQEEGRRRHRLVAVDVGQGRHSRVERRSRIPERLAGHRHLCRHIAPGSAPVEGIDPAWVEERIGARLAARKAKDFARADAIRAEVTERGVELRDGPSGTDWRVLL